MARMTMTQRKKLMANKKSNFALPEKAPKKGSYPIHDLKHAKSAWGLRNFAYKQGTISKAKCEKVGRAIVNKYPSHFKRGGVKCGGK